MDPEQIAAKIDRPKSGGSHSQFMNHSNTYTYTPYQIKVAQYNVCTIKKAVAWKELATKLAKHGIGIMCIQEARGKIEGVRRYGQFLIAASASTVDGDYGCEIWINTQVPLMLCDFGDGRPPQKKCVAFEDVSCIILEPRLLCARIHMQGCSFAVMCAHAPHKHGKVRDQWWDHFTCTYNNIYHKFKNVLIGIDANVSFCGTSGASLAVGKVGKAKAISAHAPAVFAKLDEMNNISIASTHEHNCNEDFVCSPYTFCHKSSKLMRTLDYLGCAGGISVVPQSISQYIDICIADKSMDHIPMIGKFMMPVGSHEPPFKRRVLQYDKGKIGDSVCDNKFMHNIQNIKIPMYLIENTSHCHILDEEVRTAAADAYPVKNRVKKTVGRIYLRVPLS